jgi:hypothetical protein
MPCIVKSLDIAFYPVPKNACTSIKTMMYYLAEGMYPNYPNPQQIHSWYKTEGFSISESRHRFCIVRDPFDRFMSTFLSIIQEQGSISRIDPCILESGDIKLPVDPTLEEFCLNFDKYRFVSDHISHHFQQQSFFLGSSLNSFTKVFTWENIGEIVDYIKEATGKDLEIKHMNKTNLSRGDFPSWIRPHIERFYFGDYALLSDFYRPSGV